MTDLLLRLSPHMKEYADIDQEELARGALALHLTQFGWAKFTVRFGAVNHMDEPPIPEGVSYARASVVESGREDWPYRVRLDCTIFYPDFEVDQTEDGDRGDNREDMEDSRQVTVWVWAKDISIEFELLDYSRHFSSMLTTSVEHAAQCLLGKRQLLGDDGLNDRERELINASWLVHLLAGGEPLEEALAMQGDGFSLADGVDRAALAAPEVSTDGKLVKLIQDYARALRTNDTTFQSGRRKAITRRYQWITWNADGLLLYHRLFLRFAEACSGFAGSASAPPGDDGFLLIDKTLQANGFSGQYPHYRRRYHRTGEYVTVEAVPLPRGNREDKLFNYTFHAGVGHLSGSKKAGYRLGPIPFDQTIAYDCQWERTGPPANNRYRELFSMTEPEKLESTLDALLDAFDGKWLPKESREELYGRIGVKEVLNKGVLIIFAICGLFVSIALELFAVALMLVVGGIAALIEHSWGPLASMFEWGIFLKLFLWGFFGGGAAIILAMLWETRLALGVVALRRRRRLKNRGRSS